MAELTQSKYAAKRASGQQMYGPGCCAHKLTIDRERMLRRCAERDAQLARDARWQAFQRRWGQE